MKKLVALAVVSALGTTSGAALARTYGDTARVIESRPIYEQVSVPAQQCWTEPVTTYQPQRVVREVPRTYEVRDNAFGPATLIGAIVGGAVGHEANHGHNHGNRHHHDNGAAIAGALVGGLIGNAVDNQGSARRVTAPVQEVGVRYVPVTRTVERCRTVASLQQQIVGYDVRYEYHGRVYHTRMEQAPGRYVSHRPAPVTPVYVRGF